VRIIIECPENTFSTKRPDTFTQTILRQASTLLQYGGGPYILDTYLRQPYFTTSE
jgi:hypothetical protein